MSEHLSIGSRTIEAVHEAAADGLTANEQRYTSGRRQLVDALHEAGRPLRLPEIVEAVPGLPQSSAYRNLDVMVQAGVIHRITVGGDHTHFELAEPLLGHHHHLICVGCGRIEDIHLEAELEEAVDNGLREAATNASFTPLHHSLDMHGYCDDCDDDVT